MQLNIIIRPDGEEWAGEVSLRMVSVARQSGVQVIVVHNRCLCQEPIRLCHKLLGRNFYDCVYPGNPAVSRMNEESCERSGGNGDLLSS